MKLSQINYKFDEAIELEILNPETNQSFETPAFISAISIESEAGKKIQLDMYREIIANKGKVIEDKATHKHLAKLITSWRGIEDEKGKEVPFSYEKAVELLSNPIIYKLINHQTAQMGNFKK